MSFLTITISLPWFAWISFICAVILFLIGVHLREKELMK